MQEGFFMVGTRSTASLTIIGNEVSLQAFSHKKLADRLSSLHLYFIVHLAHVRLRDFRNYARLETDFGPGFHLLLGGNAQGKTNLLEAIYLMATLRSFRG